MRLLKRDSILTTFKKVIASENHHKFLKNKVNLLFFLIPLNQNLQTIHLSTQEFLEVSQHFPALHHEKKNINISYLQQKFLWRLSLKPSQPYLFCFFLICWSDWPKSKYGNFFDGDSYIIPDNEKNPYSNVCKLILSRSYQLAFQSVNTRCYQHITTMNFGRCYISYKILQMKITVKERNCLSTITFQTFFV